MATVDYLGGRSGVQYDGIQIEEDTDGVDLQNVLLVGEFKRGPFNRPFKVTKETMEAKLSFDYNNPYYTFLEDAFEHGAEYIWVMRVSREQVVEPEPIWGDWILNSGVTVNTNGIAHYTAYKTNQREYYDSYANLDLTTAIVRSLHDSDMQQWQAVKNAGDQLTGVNTWTFDTENNQILFAVAPVNYPYLKRVWTAPVYDGLPNPQTKAYFDTAEGACRAYSTFFALASPANKYVYRYTGTVNNYGSYSNAQCYYGSTIDNGTTSIQMVDEPNPYYNPNYIPTFNAVSFTALATKIISNVSLSNEAISLLAEAYLEAVANSIFNTDPSKQFVKQSDLVPQFEANKTQR